MEETSGFEFSSPTSDNLTPQVTTRQDAIDMGPDGAGVPCPGSSSVAEVAKFEAPTGAETIGPDHVSLGRSQCPVPQPVYRNKSMPLKDVRALVPRVYLSSQN